MLVGQLIILDLSMQKENQMYKALKDDKIIAINETGSFPCLVYDIIEEDDKHTVKDYIQANGEFVLSTSDEAIEQKKEQVRQVRNNYLVDFVDPKQLVIRWNTLSETEQGYLTEYRQYLLNYPESSETWYEQNPLDWESWLLAFHPVVKEENNNV